MVSPVFAEEAVQDITVTDTQTGPHLYIAETSASTDANIAGDIPLGTIPSELINVKFSIGNKGVSTARGYRVHLFLIRPGNETEKVSQIGSDFVDNLLAPGEIRTYIKSMVVPDSIKTGDYQVLIKLDTDEFFTNPYPQDESYVVDKILKLGMNGALAGTTPVYSPATISSAGTYVLKRDITGNKGSDIFTVTSSGVTIDGGGYTIRGQPSGLTTGIAVKGNSMLKDITIRNLNIDGIDTGVSFYNVDKGTITNCNFTNEKNMGLRFDRSRSFTISDNHFTDNDIGLGLFQSAGNIITNNYFKNTNNAVVNQEFKNKWSVNTTAGENIAGGSTLGGNLWLKPDGQSASTPIDSNKDGIADSPYVIDPDNIDYAPLLQSSTTDLPREQNVPIATENAPNGAGNISEKLGIIQGNATSANNRTGNL